MCTALKFDAISQFFHLLSSVEMRRTDLEGSALGRYPLILEQQFRFQN